MERPANTEIDTTPAAPGDLELVRAFMSLHDHGPGEKTGTLPPGPATIAWCLQEAGLLSPTDESHDDDLEWAARVLEALRSRVMENMGQASDPAALETLNAAALEAGLSVRFDDALLAPTATGVRGAVGRVLAVAFLAELDGSWARFKECSSPDCRSIFYDRSKNGSGRWCVMAECGNRAKVRAYRERERTKT